MMEFEKYFSFEAILDNLIRLRIRGLDVGKMLPARKDWSRLGAKGRGKKSPKTVRRLAIMRTVMHCRKDGSIADWNWGRQLLEFVDRVRDSVLNGSVEFEPPRMIKIFKGNINGRPEYRTVAAFDNIADRVVLSCITAYVRDALEGILTEDCYSFRKDSNVNHQLAVKKLQEWRRANAHESMYVAECDIQKFFDKISHGVVRDCWKRLGFDPAAGRILDAYLDVYSSLDSERRGLPQGGAFSTVLANMVLMSADEVVRDMGHEGLFYARFCDDVIFAHSDESVCWAAMEAYQAELERLELPIHPVRRFAYKPSGGESTSYYGIKSKGPFLWGEAKPGEENVAPWVSFLGSQIRFDGETRIRKESVKKHIRSLGRETAKAVREIESGNVHLKDMKESRKWFARFRNRLITKGVGYVTAKVKDCDMCWAGSFRMVTACADTVMQMRRLDRVREGMLTKVKSVLCGAGLLDRCTGVAGRHYKGRPFCYFAFLDEKTKRPTNMSPQRKIRLLPYSEL